MKEKSNKSKSDLHSAVYCDLFGYKEINEANEIIDKAGVTDRGVSKYIVDRFGEDHIDLLNTHLRTFVYEYIFTRVEKLLDYELEFSFSEVDRRATFDHPRLEACEDGYYFPPINSTNSEEEEEEYLTGLLAQCEKIKNRPQFLTWFIERLKNPVIGYK